MNIQHSLIIWGKIWFKNPHLKSICKWPWHRVGGGGGRRQRAWPHHCFCSIHFTSVYNLVIKFGRSCTPIPRNSIWNNGGYCFSRITNTSTYAIPKQNKENLLGIEEPLFPVKREKQIDIYYYYHSCHHVAW